MTVGHPLLCVACRAYDCRYCQGAVVTCECLRRECLSRLEAP